MSLRRSARTANSRPAFLAGSSFNSKRPLSSQKGLELSAKRTKRNSLNEDSHIDSSQETSATLSPQSKFKPKSKPKPRSPNAPNTSVPIPTPSVAGAVNSPTHSTGNSGDVNPTPPIRPADPRTSNATLVTPGGTKATAYPPGPLDPSPAKSGPYQPPHPSSSTATLLSQACSHLISVDPKIAPLVRKHQCHIFSPSGLAEEVDAFRSLATGIISQQVSGAAAKSIKRKFIALFTEDVPTESKFPAPTLVAATDISKLRLAGLSQRKAEYIHGLAEKFASGDLSTEILLRASDDEIMEKLINVRGLGKWSVEMFTCLGLKRMDVFSTGDLGVQRGIAAFMGKDVSKLKAKGGGKWKYMSERDMLEASEKFRPYRSLFMWYMWRAENIDIGAMDGTGGLARQGAHSIDTE